MIIAALIMLLGGGAGGLGIWLLPENFTDQVNEIIVEDDDRQDKVLEIYDQMTKTEKDFNDNFQNSVDLLETILSNPNTTDSEFNDMMDKMIQDKEGMQKNILAARMDLVKNITKDEWNKIHTPPDEDDN